MSPPPHTQLSNRERVAQNIVLHEAVVKPGRLLDQFRDGLNEGGLLEAMKLFPDVFLSLFTYSGMLDATEVINALILVRTDSEDPGWMDKLFTKLTRYIEQCSVEGN